MISLLKICKTFEFLFFDDFNDHQFADELNKDYVILPLYGTKKVKKLKKLS